HGCVQLARVPVGSGMQLSNTGCELGCEIWNNWSLIATRCDHDTVRQHLTGRRHESEAVVSPRQPVDSYAVSYRKVEVPCVLLEVIGHLAMSSEGVQPHWPTRQARVPRGREQSERVPPVAPAVADTCIGIENDELLTGSPQVVAHHQSCLPPADDHRREGFGAVGRGRGLNEMHAGGCHALTVGART